MSRRELNPGCALLARVLSLAPRDADDAALVARLAASRARHAARDAAERSPAAVAEARGEYARALREQDAADAMPLSRAS